MSSSYAVRNAQGRIVFVSEGFDMHGITQTLPLSQGAELLIAGESDELLELSLQLRQAQEANLAKEAFLSSMSHDIRTPMNAIVGMTALARKYIDEKPRVIDALSKIETASGHLLELINDVLDMSRINSGRMQLTKEPFFLNDLVHDTLLLVRPQLEKKKHRMETDFHGIEAECLVGDSLRLRQVFVNILSNAVKYTPDGGTVRLTVSSRLSGEMSELCFICEDNGVGMSEAFLARIFVPFERVNNSTISRIEGTGLGMSIVKNLVESMDGHIEIRSEEGKGTVVSVSVPLQAEPLEPDLDAVRHKHVLILEADEDLAPRYHAIFEEYALSYTPADSAQSALSALTDAAYRSEPFDALILGRSCLGSDDMLEVAQYIHKAWPDLPMMIVSDAVWEDIEYRANRCGIYQFVPLPLFRKTLLGGIVRLMDSTKDNTPSHGFPDLLGKKILAAEDNLINQEIVRELLSSVHAQVDIADDGKQAVELFLSSPEGAYSIILMDVQMPVMDGYTATREIRGSARSDAATVPIYAMTANTFAEDIAKAKQAGMNGHLAKPINIDAFMQLLRQL